MRRKPEMPKPWSCSVIMEDLVIWSDSATPDPESKENLSLGFSGPSATIARFPVLRFLGNRKGAESLELLVEPRPRCGSGSPSC